MYLQTEVGRTTDGRQPPNVLIKITSGHRRHLKSEILFYLCSRTELLCFRFGFTDVLTGKGTPIYRERSHLRDASSLVSELVKSAYKWKK